MSLLHNAEYYAKNHNSKVFNFKRVNLFLATDTRLN